MGVTRIELNQNRESGLKIESKLIENRNLQIVTSLVKIATCSSEIGRISGNHAV